MKIETAMPPPTEIAVRSDCLATCDLLATSQSNIAVRLRSKCLSLLATVAVLAAGLAAEEVSLALPAHAESITYSDLDYPWHDATPIDADYDWGYDACPSSDPGCMSPFYGYLKGVKYGETDPWNYYLRNCTSYVAWKERSVGAQVGTLGNAGDWYNNVPAAKRSSTPKPWDAAVQPPSKAQPSGHVAFVESVNRVDPTNSANDELIVSEYNYDGRGNGDRRIGTAAALGLTEFIDFGVHPQTTGLFPNPNNALQMLLTTAGAVYGKNETGYGQWNMETDADTILQIAAGGNVQLALANNGEVWARAAETGGGIDVWTKETDAGIGTEVAVSSAGIQLVRTTDNEVWAKNSISYGGWTGEAGPGTAAAIAVGGDTQMLMTGDGTVYAKQGISVGGWRQETAAGVAQEIAATATGLQVIQVTDGEVWAKQNDTTYGGWTGEAPPGAAAGVAAGGNTQMLWTADGRLFAKDTLAPNGWQQETDPYVVAEASVSTTGLQILATTNGEVWAKTSIGYGNWTAEAGPGIAAAVTTTG